MQTDRKFINFFSQDNKKYNYTTFWRYATYKKIKNNKGRTKKSDSALVTTINFISHRRYNH